MHSRIAWENLRAFKFHKRLTTFTVVVKTPSRVSFDNFDSSYPGNKYRHFFINVIDHIKFHMVLLAHDCIHVRLLNTQPPSSKPYLRCQKFLKKSTCIMKVPFFQKINSLMKYNCIQFTGEESSYRFMYVLPPEVRSFMQLRFFIFIFLALCSSFFFINLH